MILIAIAGTLFACATIPALLFIINLRRYAPPRDVPADPAAHQRISVLIPARNEEANIAACLDSVLASHSITLEVLVLDDASTDSTAAIVRSIAARDPRVRLVATKVLPSGWNGKQHACWLLAQQADAPLLCFPRQITIGWMERQLLPLIHFVLLGFLPIGRMRKTTKVGYAAGCGQFFVTDREAYFACGGHAAIKETRHDGLRLPQAFRRAGLRTDLVDITGLAEVRMYDSPHAVWMGLAKNATEGLAAPARIVPLSLLLLLGQILPLPAALLWLAFCISNLVVGATFDAPAQAAAVSILLSLSVAASYTPRLLAVRQFKQPLGSALLHPLGIAMLLAIQWYALAKQLLGRPVAWRARAYASGSGEEIAAVDKVA